MCPVTCHGHPSNFFRFNSSSMSCFMTNAVDSSSVRRRVIVVLELAKAFSPVNYSSRSSFTHFQLVGRLGGRARATRCCAQLHAPWWPSAFVVTLSIHSSGEVAPLPVSTGSMSLDHASRIKHDYSAFLRTMRPGWPKTFPLAWRFVRQPRRSSHSVHNSGDTLLC